MDQLTNEIKSIEDKIETALWVKEVHEKLDEALNAYRAGEAELTALNIEVHDPAYTEQQRVLAYCLMRQGNILRQMGRSQEALAIGKREINAARASGDETTLARSLMSNGTNQIVSDEIEAGLKLLDEARGLFASGDDFDHHQGLGWYWILQADLANAGLTQKEPADVIEYANQALEILEPIENWPGVARAYAARAGAYEKLGKTEQATKDRQEQRRSESRIDSEMEQD